MDRKLPQQDVWVYLKNKNDEMIDLIESGVLKLDVRHDVVMNEPIFDVDDEGDEDGESELDEESDISLPETSSRVRGPSVRTRAYTNLTTFLFPLAQMKNNPYDNRTLSKLFFTFSKNFCF